jgi:hypothetical protein
MDLMAGVAIADVPPAMNGYGCNRILAALAQA